MIPLSETGLVSSLGRETGLLELKLEPRGQEGRIVMEFYSFVIAFSERSKDADITSELLFI